MTPVAGSVVNEVGGSADFDIVLTSAPTADVTVALSLSDDGEGTLSGSTLTFTSTNWNVAQTITVTGDADDLVDADVTFELMAVAASTDTVYDGVAATDVSIINENRDAATLSIAAAQATEGRAGLAGTLSFVVTLDTAVEGGVMVRASARDLTAVGGVDYSNLIDRLEFVGTAGETVTFSVPLLGNSDIEGNKTLEGFIGIIEGLGTGIDAADVTLGQASAVGTIIEDDLGDIGFTLTAASFDEQAGTQTLTITLLTTANGELSEDVSVQITDLLTGTADPTNDYTFATQTVVFAAGSGDQETQSFTIAITDDQEIEINETIDLGLAILGDGISGAVGATLQVAMTVTITDEPGTGVITGTVRVDSNGDGIVQTGERPIAGVTVQLTGTDSQGNAVSLEQVTDADGGYRFEDLAAGEYRVTKIQPVNYANGSATVGTIGGTADGVASANLIDEITLPAAGVAEAYNFTELGLAAGFVDLRSFLATTLGDTTATAPIAALTASASTAASSSATSSAADTTVGIALATAASESSASGIEETIATISLAVAADSSDAAADEATEAIAEAMTEETSSPTEPATTVSTGVAASTDSSTEPSAEASTDTDEAAIRDQAYAYFAMLEETDDEESPVAY